MRQYCESKRFTSTKKKKDAWDSYQGYRLVTDKQDIYVLVSDQSSCCESWGHLTTNDDIKEFEGAQLKGVVKVDSALNAKKLQELEYADEGSAMFVNFETDRGTLQLVVYNSHNGYYGHSAKIISKQLTMETIL